MSVQFQVISGRTGQTACVDLTLTRHAGVVISNRLRSANRLGLCSILQKRCECGCFVINLGPCPSAASMNLHGRVKGMALWLLNSDIIASPPRTRASSGASCIQWYVMLPKLWNLAHFINVFSIHSDLQSQFERPNLEVQLPLAVVEF